MRKQTMAILSVLSGILLTACSAREEQMQVAAKEPGSSTHAEGGNNAVIGEIILSDGSVIDADGLTLVDENCFPIAVIAGIKADGTAFGIGVHRSDSPRQWAAGESAGYETRFADIVCVQADEGVFTGDEDGSDNWEIICAQDGEDTADAGKNYPAFHFVNTYAETYHLPDAYASGWYMPDIAELYQIYQNRETITASLQKINELDGTAAMDGLGTNWYWSSSQAQRMITHGLSITLTDMPENALKILPMYMCLRFGHFERSNRS